MTKKEARVEQLVRRRLRESLALKRRLLRDRALVRGVVEVGLRLAGSLEAGGKVVFFGNGGSAADAQHLAAELVGRFRSERCALPALALSVNTSALTAIANDSSFDRIFARQIEALGAPGDVALAISTSGNSPNVLRGVRAARARRMATVGLTGASGGRLKPLVDTCLCVPASETPRIQEAHILLGHILCEIVEARFVRGPVGALKAAPRKSRGGKQQGPKR